MTVTARIFSTFGDALDFIVQPREPAAAAARSAALEQLALHAGSTCSSASSRWRSPARSPCRSALWLGHTRRGAFLAVERVEHRARGAGRSALVFVFFAFLGAGFANVALALALLAIPPILTNAYVGVREVDRDAVDAARGMGMTGLQILRRVELPARAAAHLRRHPDVRRQRRRHRHDRAARGRRDARRPHHQPQRSTARRAASAARSSSRSSPSRPSCRSPPYNAR